MSEQRGGTPLTLSSAVVTAGGGGPDCLQRLELSVSVRVLGGLEIVLAATEESGEAGIPAARQRVLHVNPILLSLVPDVIHLAGRGDGPGHDELAAPSYTLTLIFSDGSLTTEFWSTTFDVPPTAPGWHLKLPFDRPTGRGTAPWSTNAGRPSRRGPRR